MTIAFTLLAQTRQDVFAANASIGDATKYQIDCTPWQEDNGTITSAEWTVESGTASIASENLTSGITSAIITYTQAGKALTSILLTTATTKKKIWLAVSVKDMKLLADDYGIEC